MTASEFEQLIIKFSRGDKKSFTDIFNEFYDKLVGAAFLILHDKEDSQNVASDIFVKLISNPLSFRNIKNPSAYLFTITQNHAKNYLRHNQQHLKILPQLYNENFEYCKCSELDFYNLISENFNKTEQEMIILRCVWDFTYANIAKQLQIPLGTVKIRFRAFKRRLRGKLK